MALSYGVSLGKLDSRYGFFEHCYEYCTACFETVYVSQHEEYFSNNLIYPNPTGEKLNFKWSGNLKIVIYNSLEAKVKEEFIEGKSTTGISPLPNGLYLIEIQTDSFKSTQKLIIQH
ncbi:MAG: T9SS type A sorting domain-containing protein [Bacteroidota bacterium]|nr:T9SS type A sorting domain-containing protein [Bacteroidota bacterium]